MTTIERLRETCGAFGVRTAMPDECTIDGTTYENHLPLTFGDARKLLALVEEVSAYLRSDLTDSDACYDRMEAAFKALTTGPADTE